ncbi:MAG: hypothetical protein ABL998_21395, partial [Planctomycetota bacterium]
SLLDAVAFLRAEFAAARRALQEELHVLASTYHWSEAEILALPSDRRRRYVARILADRGVRSA